MPKQLTKLLLVPLLLSAVVALPACQLAPKAPVGVLVENPLEPEPLAAPFRTEIAIARISEMLQSAKMDDAERGRLHYDRGVMYDSVGLSALARYDFMRALRLQPDMADAYNFMGIQHTLSGDYELAYDAFDSALELEPKYQYAYLNRGIALQYDGKLALAISDFQQFQALKPDDPYRSLWLFLAGAEQSEPQALALLAKQQAALDKKAWSAQIVAFYLGQISEAELLELASTDATDPKQLAEQLCEVYFYLARWHALKHNPTQAALYFKKSLATNVYEFVEHRYARLELERLRQAVIEQADAHEHGGSSEQTDEQDKSDAHQH
ncbi:lipoprotein NlpI [Rheinheimera texasensis]|uniref:lipoprotein NlpI n=1 Tax=Rheinheimera texasensis TaxID=306205 RepID=UPI000A05B8E8|nr:lipoprotein NlpI [Rheinheimera texasensis]